MHLNKKKKKKGGVIINLDHRDLFFYSGTNFRIILTLCIEQIDLHHNDIYPLNIHVWESWVRRL